MQRRRFLRLSLITTASIGTAVVSLRAGGVRLYRNLRARYEAALRLPHATPGPLDPHTHRTLIGVTDVLLAGTPAEKSARTQYDDLFSWNAQNRPGYRAIYDRLTAALDAAARDAGATNFASADMAVRQAAFAEVVAPQVPQTKQEQLRAAFFQEDRWVYRVNVTGEILRLFCRTDAMAALGYDPWPGLPRGLDDYTRPVPDDRP
jgi:hypothetical protein